MNSQEMALEVYFNYSSTDVTELSNTSNTTVQASIGEESFEWTNEEIARFIQIIFRPLLIIVGTIGNGLTFYITRGTSLKDVSSCFYMSILALADSGKSM